MINFTRAFDSAWERMMIILFRPFDLGKWFVIGFSAFLAGFLQGGNGLNSSFNTNNFNNSSFNKYGAKQTPNFDLHQFNSNVAQAISGMQVGIIVLIFLVTIAFIFAFILLLYWLGARGQFMFLDNIVRNRGAISWPWQYYKRQANSLFGFYLIVVFIFLVLVLPLILIFLGAAVGGSVFETILQRHPGGLVLAGLIALSVAYLALWVVIGFVMFVFREFGIPLMFRNGLLARPAFWESVKLVRQHTGSIALFVLLRIAIFVGVAILSLIICCATCCIGALPYIGTVILLPVLVYVRCFTLDCLAQFGPEYDVWTVDVPPTGPVGIPPFNPQPPLG